MVIKKSTDALANVRFIDSWDHFTANGKIIEDLYHPVNCTDDVHLTSSGLVVLGGIWYDAISEFLNNGS